MLSLSIREDVAQFYEGEFFIREQSGCLPSAPSYLHDDVCLPHLRTDEWMAAFSTLGPTSNDWNPLPTSNDWNPL